MGRTINTAMSIVWTALYNMSITKKLRAPGADYRGIDIVGKDLQNADPKGAVLADMYVKGTNLSLAKGGRPQEGGNIHE